MSHTTDDLVFRWLSEEKVPLFVDPSVELPQLELVSNVTGDCTSVYSTGDNTIYARQSHEAADQGVAFLLLQYFRGIARFEYILHTFTNCWYFDIASPPNCSQMSFCAVRADGSN